MGATAGGFRISVETHQAYWLAGGSALTSSGTHSGLPKIEIACMGSSCPTDKAHKTAGTAPNGLPVASSNCMGLLTRHFAFDQVSGSGSGNPSWVDDASTTQTFVYAAVNVIQAAKVWGETYTTTYVERLAIETISFYFKFTKQITVTATSTVTYAAVQINVVLTQSSVTPVTLASFINKVTNLGVACSVANSAHGASYCGINPQVKLEVGITTITNLPFMTVLHVTGDSPGTASSTVPLPKGINISAKDIASGLALDNTATYNGSTGSTFRTHTAGTVPATCNGNCDVGSGNCTGSCALSYKAFLVYQRDVSGGTTANGAAVAYTPTDTSQVNTLNTQCQIVGAVLTIGNNGVGMTTPRYQEIQCRSAVNSAVYGLAGTNADPPCPFAPDGTDADDDFQLTVTITTSNWCPNVIADNQVVGFMTTSHDSYFDGNRLDIKVYVQAQGANGSNNLDIDKVKWHSLRGSCASGTGDDCNVGGDGVGTAASTNSVYIISNSGSPAITTLGQTYQVSGVDSYDGCSQTTAAALSNSVSNSTPYHCMITASVYLCQHSPYNAGCPASGPSAFEIDDNATSTKIILTGELKVGYPSVPIARKRTIEIEQGVEKMYALLQNTEGTAEAEVEAGIARAPTEEVEDFTEDVVTDNQSGGNNNTAAVEEESNPMLIYIIVGVFLFISVFVGALVMYLRRSKAEKKAEHPVPITVEVNKNTAAMA